MVEMSFEILLIIMLFFFIFGFMLGVSMTRPSRY